MNTPQNFWKLNYGAVPNEDGSVTFHVWAPFAKELSLKIIEDKGSPLPMKPSDDGCFEATLSNCSDMCNYFYILDGAKERPDPVSRWQPHGVHGPSRFFHPDNFVWTDFDWRGIELEDYLIYELHIGTFTSEGTFDAAIEKLIHLKELGITAVELMPVAQFPGERNWGYDGVHPYAVQDSYGGPEGLKRFVNACHETGLAVVLDVVYNHLGPEGNYLAEYAPYFTDRYQTPWGKAINYDGRDSDPVRRYFIDNALYWLTEYHIDALRLDAIHAIFDFSAFHFLLELHRNFQRQAEQLGRKAWLIAESDLNDVRVINPEEQGGYAIDAQWNDDFHHSLHSIMTKKSNGYFADFGSLSDLGKAIREGFVNDGRWSPFRRKRHGNSSLNTPGKQFVVCIQNHDQIANACRGDRIATIVTQEQQKLAAALLCCAPNLPLLFMGQEWAETHPFLYFTSHGDPDLIEAVRKGYAEECAAYDFHGKEIDPQDKQSFLASRLDWNKPSLPGHKEHLQFYKDLISLRKRHPSLKNCRKDLCTVQFSEDEQWFILLREDPLARISHTISSECGQDVASALPSKAREHCQTDKARAIERKDGVTDCPDSPRECEKCGLGEKSLLVCNFSSSKNTIPANFPKGKWQLVIDTADVGYGGPGNQAAERSLSLSKDETRFIETSPWSACLYLSHLKSKAYFH